MADRKRQTVPHFPFYGNDFMAATTGWTLAERGAYVSLLIVQWDQGAVPTDTERLRLIHPELPKMWKRLEEKFPVGSDGKRRNPRLETIRDEFHAVLEKRSGAASKAAKARWAQERGDDASGNADACADASESQCDRISGGNATQTHTHITTTSSPSAPAREAPGNGADDPRLTPIPDDWTPDKSIYPYAATKGFDREATDKLVPEFVQYWQARGDHKPRGEWRRKFINLISRLHEQGYTDAAVHNEGKSNAAQQKHGGSGRASVIDAIYDPLRDDEPA